MTPGLVLFRSHRRYILDFFVCALYHHFTSITFTSITNSDVTYMTVGVVVRGEGESRRRESVI